MKSLLYFVYLLGKYSRVTVELVFKKLGALKMPSIKVESSFFEYISYLKLKLRFLLYGSLPNKKIFLLIFVSTTVYFVTGFINTTLANLPDPQDLINRKIQASTKIYDRNGVLLYKIYKDQNRTVVPLSEIPKSVQLATLAVEDAEFYSHPGFSIKGIIRSIIKNTQEQRLTGGSTITQQLVKNALLTPEKTLTRKLREVVLSMQVEREFSKDQILEMYLNEVSYGNSAYGIEEAARVYFGKNAKDLSLGEASLLAGLPKSPTLFSPFGTDPTRAIARQREVLSLMVLNGFISAEQATSAGEEKLTFVPRAVEIKAPHFVMYVKEKLVEKYGEEMVEKGGLEVTTTLDLNIQLMAEEVVKSETEKIKRLNVGNAAVLVLHPQTGEILAMVGSKDYFDTANDGNVNVVLRERSPGSSIKIVTYAYALSHGMTPATTLADTPLSINIPGQKAYNPKNYDGKFRGNLTLRSAFAESRNIPAVRTLMTFGLSSIIDMGQKLGITSWNNTSRYGPSLTLGGGEVKLIDLAQVYATVANYGKKPSLQYSLEISNQKGETLEETYCTLLTINFCKYPQILDPRVAFLIIDILRDNQARSPSFGSNSSLVISNHAEVAVKTGTSNDLRDNLTLGFNQNYLVAVWVGNNDNSPMTRIASGVTGAAPIWNKVMTALIGNDSNHPWEVPSGIEQTKLCPWDKPEWYLTDSKPSKNCILPSPSPLPTPTPAPVPQKPRGRRR